MKKDLLTSLLTLPGFFSFSQRPPEPLILELRTADARVPGATIRIYPNPIRDQLQLEIRGAEAGLFRLQLRDALGRRGWRKAQRDAGGGDKNTCEVPPGVSAGSYLIEISPGNEQLQRKLIKIE